MSPVGPSPPAAATTNPAANTPMMRQYLDAKAQHSDAIVLFRMGDFYETFFDDAVDAARLLELTLTSRNKNDDNPIPMAGVPHHALWSYVPRLLAAGRKVAICEQVEDPRTAKGIVKREVVRVITPGVVLDERVLERGTNNFLAAVRRLPGSEALGLAWVDASTGERRVASVRGLDRALSELGRIEPAELLVDAADTELIATLRPRLDGVLMSPMSPPPIQGELLLDTGAMVDAYLKDTQKSGVLPLKPLETEDLDASLRLGAETVRNLELLRTLADGRRKGSLLGLIDQTRTAMGGRKLKRWMLYPLRDPAAIDQRLDAVQALVVDPTVRSEIRDHLQGVHDLERLVTRTVAGSATPRDLVALASSLEHVPDLVGILEATGDPVLAAVATGFDPVPEATRLVREALVDEPPPSMKDGGAIREGHSPELDALMAIAADGKSWFNAYADELRAASGITSLKIRYNNVFGYFIEVTKSNLELVPETWLRKQTLANAERYYTAELKAREETVLGAHDRRVALEHALFDGLRESLTDLGPPIQATADRLARLDVIASLAELAQRRGYNRPTVDDGAVIAIEGGRHPVLEALMPAGEFVPNDTRLDADGEQILIVTGPNMSGKSTVMRQVALISVLAQMGSFVPAATARIGVVDQVFTRVGASDNLARGQSTFMVEMTETATILEDATAQSLVILDEIGRGTSTYDGVSIAWAVVEHLHEQLGARTLFATHYHELTELAGTMDRVRNVSIAVKRWKDDIVFLRQLIPGGTSHSYGIQVARLAGLPPSVVERAREVLENLEATALDRNSRPRLARSDADTPPEGGWQLSLFAGDPAGPGLRRLLETADPDALTPREAHALLYELKSLVDDT
jgi:DNA mismatch repair protein MutS